MKKIGLLCLLLSSLSLVGCFHIPDEDWLPSKNKEKPVEINNEFDEALDIFVQGMDALSTQREQRKNNDDSLTGDEIGYGGEESIMSGSETNN